MCVAEAINEGNRTRSGCSKPPSGSSSGGDDGEHDHSQQYEPTERTYYIQNGTPIDHSPGNKHYQPIEGNTCDANPARNADSTVLRRVHCSPNLSAEQPLAEDNCREQAFTLVDRERSSILNDGHAGKFMREGYENDGRDGQI